MENGAAVERGTKMENKRTSALIWGICACAVLAVFAGACSRGEPWSPYDESEPDVSLGFVGVFGDEIHAPGMSIVHGGIVQDEWMSVAPGSLAAVVDEVTGEVYLVYNDGETWEAPLSEELSAWAFVAFGLRLYEHQAEFEAQLESLPDGAMPSFSGFFTFGDCSWFGGTDYDLLTGTGIAVTQSGGELDLENCKVRVASVASGGGRSLLPAKDVAPDISMLVEMGFEELIGLEYTVPAGGTLESHGAVVRAALQPAAWLVVLANPDLLASLEQGMAIDPETVNLVNTADLLVLVVDAIHEIVGFIPVIGDCLNFVFVNPLVDSVGALLAAMIDDDSLGLAQAADLMGSSTEDLSMCILDGVTEASAAASSGGVLLAVKKILDLGFLAGTLVEDFGVGAWQSATGVAYESIVFDTDDVMQVELRWEAPPNDLDLNMWCPDGARVSNVEYSTYGAYLDTDQWFGGVETIHITELTPGTYDVAVYNYSLLPSLGGAATLVIRGPSGEQLYSATAPGGGSESQVWWWAVQIDGSTGGITPVNVLAEEPPRVD